MLTSLLPLLCLGFSHLANAIPQKPTELLAFSPTIEEPTFGTVWPTGSNQMVKWKTTNVPTEAQGYSVDIILGYLSDGSENLDLNNPLASGVPIMDGNSLVQVPDKPDGDNYIVVVLGTSGDASPPFTIMHA